ncbi:MAG: hypothetical protein ACPGRX_08310 [Bdellovibrionales bacterium]
MDAVSGAYAKPVLEKSCVNDQTIVLMMDQSHINTMNETLMLSIRMGERAIPFLWRVRTTQGNIGFEVQKEMLDAARAFMPKDADIMLAADRVYGTACVGGLKACSQTSKAGTLA